LHYPTTAISELKGESPKADKSTSWLDPNVTFGGMKIHGQPASTRPTTENNQDA